MPSLLDRSSIRGLVLDGRVRAVCLDEPDEGVVLANMRARGRGFEVMSAPEQRTEARTKWLFGRWLVIGASWLEVTRLIVFAGVDLILVYGNVVYQVSRLGYLVRPRRHRPGPYEALIRGGAGSGTPPVVVLAPSFREDPGTIRRTLLLAAPHD